jgi:SAM-dependent methyltransferase
MRKYNALLELGKIIFAPKYGYYKFLKRIKPKEVFLDIGPGGDAPYLKRIIPKSKYIGVDIIGYDPVLHGTMERYIETTPEKFAETIKTLKNSIDVAFSKHNLEHCNNMIETIKAIALSLKSGGRIFIAFPSERSVKFPSRRGTLNYYDDKQHKGEPPVFSDVIRTLENEGIKIEYKSDAYKPMFLFLIGMALEPISALLRKNMIGTWSFWGFEAVIWGIKER